VTEPLAARDGLEQYYEWETDKIICGREKK